MKFIQYLSPVGAVMASMLFLASCSKTETLDRNTNQPRLEVRLTDSPDPDVKEVWIDVKAVNITMNDSSQEIGLSGSHPGLYNLLNFTNGRDTVLADALIPAGTISQIRMVLGDNNYIITNSGEKFALTTPSAQQSGLKMQVKQPVTGGILYRLILDFDAGKSIVKAGNSGKYILKPVIRVLSFVPSGGNLRGVVWPTSVTTGVYAINGNDTVASTFTDNTNGNYFIRDIAAGAYSLQFNPLDTTYKTAQRNAAIVLGQVTTADTVKLEKK